MKDFTRKLGNHQLVLQVLVMEPINNKSQWVI
jgi:hypothetical protein